MCDLVSTAYATAASGRRFRRFRHYQRSHSLHSGSLSSGLWRKHIKLWLLPSTRLYGPSSRHVDRISSPQRECGIRESRRTRETKNNATTTLRDRFREEVHGMRDALVYNTYLTSMTAIDDFRVVMPPSLKCSFGGGAGWSSAYPPPTSLSLAKANVSNCERREKASKGEARHA